MAEKFMIMCKFIENDKLGHDIKERSYAICGIISGKPQCLCDMILVIVWKVWCDCKKTQQKIILSFRIMIDVNVK